MFKIKDLKDLSTNMSIEDPRSTRSMDLGSSVSWIPDHFRIMAQVCQEERHLHSLKVKQREVGYRTCWLDARPGPAWRNRPLQAEREGADVCTYLQRSGTQRTLLQGHPDGGDQPAKGPDAAADQTGLVAGEVRSVDWVRVPVWCVPVRGVCFVEV